MWFLLWKRFNRGRAYLSTRPCAHELARSKVERCLARLNRAAAAQFVQGTPGMYATVRRRPVGEAAVDPKDGVTDARTPTVGPTKCLLSTGKF